MIKNVEYNMHRWTQKNKYTKQELEELVANLHLALVPLVHQTEAVYHAYIEKTLNKYNTKKRP
ncbi:MAG: hypothetical protein IKA73_00890 [Alphaproteobacteria bacterium]|nr:hypothetical protein [Alphaproteobacteria bacterium]MBR2482866.1 hypothetical protein [Alphaproteobacteria bacterium]